METPPSRTLYISNLNDKLKAIELKLCLYALFGQFGRIIDINCTKTFKLRGQAWIVYADLSSAVHAHRSCQDFPFLGKILNVQYAKSDSKVLGKLDGILGSHVPTRQTPGMLDEKEALDKQPTTISAPNSMLFIENLPHETDEMMLKVLFEKFPGFQEARLVPGKPGIAFIEFKNKLQAGTALSGLHGFKLSENHVLKVTYAK